MGSSASKKRLDGTIDSPPGVYSSIQETSECDDVEEVVCKENEIQNGDMKLCQLGEYGSVLLVKDNGNLSALGTKCTHYGAPLIKGVLSDGRIRCPWHGACFNSNTGDIEDFPGLDSLPCYKVTIENGNVKIRASKQDLKKNKRIKHTSKRKIDDKRQFVVIGGGGAGQACVETLRQEGYTGRLILISKDVDRPYDRPKLSKALNANAEDLALRPLDYYQAADIELWLDRTVTSLDTEKKVLVCRDGTSVQYNSLFIGTGGRPKTIDATFKNVYYLRSISDANLINEKAQKKNVVILGTSFIGMEVAAYFADKAGSVSVIGQSSVPFLKTLGEQIGKFFQKLHEEKGVTFYNNSGISEFIGDNNTLTKVILKTGEHLPTDLCIIGIGVSPETNFLSNANISLNAHGHVQVNEFMETNVENVFAGGDIVEFPLSTMEGQRVNIGHWQQAQAHGRCAALNMLGKKVKLHSTPFFWCMMFGKSLRYSGYGGMFDDIIFTGSIDDQKFIAYYLKNDSVVAVATMNNDPIAARFASDLSSGKVLERSEITKWHKIV